MNGRHIEAIPDVQFASVLHQYLDNVNTPVNSAQMKGRNLAQALTVRIGFAFQQCADCFDVSVQARQMERCFFLVSFQVDALCWRGSSHCDVKENYRRVRPVSKYHTMKE